MSLAEILMRLEGVKREGAQYVALCPGHHDRHPSLAVRQHEHRILMVCRAGCRTEDVLQARGLHLRDLFVDAREPGTPRPYESVLDAARREAVACARRTPGMNPDVQDAYELADALRWLRGMADTLSERATALGDTEAGWLVAAEAARLETLWARLTAQADGDTP